MANPILNNQNHGQLKEISIICIIIFQQYFLQSNKYLNRIIRPNIKYNFGKHTILFADRFKSEIEEIKGV
jgi:hypothetical protein